MMANLVAFHINEAFNWNLASTISVILLLISAAFILVLARVRGGDLFGDRAH